MTAAVRIDSGAWDDWRFKALASLVGLADADHAIAKMAKVWAWQTERYSPESPTYVVSALLVETLVAPGAAAAVVRVELAEEVPEGLRIRGAMGRIEWKWKTLQKARNGGAATSRKWASKPPGVTPSHIEQVATSKAVAEPQAGLEEGPEAWLPAMFREAMYQTGPASPAQASPKQGLTPATAKPSSSYSFSFSSEDTDPPHPACAPARVATDEPTSAQAPSDPDEMRSKRDQLRKTVRSELEQARKRAAKARGVAYKPLLAFDLGLTADLGDHLARTQTGTDLETLLQQARHAIQMAEIRFSTGTESFEWFTGAIFRGGNFARYAAMSEQDARTKRDGGGKPIDPALTTIRKIPSLGGSTAPR